MALLKVGRRADYKSPQTEKFTLSY